jgi:hypothetical protein
MCVEYDLKTTGGDDSLSKSTKACMGLFAGRDWTANRAALTRYGTSLNFFALFLLVRLGTRRVADTFSHQNFGWVLGGPTELGDGAKTHPVCDAGAPEIRLKVGRAFS